MTTTVSSNAKVPQAEGYELRIGTKHYRLAASRQDQLVLTSKDSLAERADDKGSTSENVLDIGYAWARTDYSGGEGFDWDPPEIPATSALAAENPRRYWDSESVDISRPAAGNRYDLRLAYKFEEWNAPVTPVASLTASSVNFFVVDGEWIRWYDTFDNIVEEGSDQPSPGAAVLKVVAAPDDRVVAMLDNGELWLRVAGGLSFTLLYNPATGGDGDILNVWWANGRFIVLEDDGHLGELPLDGTSHIVIDTFDLGTTVHSVVASGPAIVAAVSDGTLRTYIADTSTGVPVLTPAGRVNVPEGETPYLLGSNAGRLLFLTYVNEGGGPRTVRLYQAEVLDARFDYVVGGIQLRREWFNTTEIVNIAANIHNNRDAMTLAIDEEGGSAIWNYDLVTQGLSRLIQPFASGETHAIIEFNGRIGLVSTSTDTIWVQSDTEYSTMGWLITPNITFGLNTDVAWLASVLEGIVAGTGGGTVELWYSTNPESILDYQHIGWKLHQRVSSQGSSGLEIGFNNVKSRTVALQLRLFPSGSGLESPLVSRTAIRGIPTHRDKVLVIPVNVSDIISVPGRRPVRVPNYGMLLQKELMEFIGENVELELLRLDMLYVGIINNVSEPIVLYSDRGSPTTVMNIEFRGSIFDISVTTGDSGVGMGHIGIDSIGLGQTGAL
jgi:hypothetical protein